MRPLVLIFTCKKYIYRCKDIQETWGHDLKKNNIDYFFVSGDNLDIEPYLNIDFKESYEQLPQKTYITFNRVKDLNYTHFIKTDDDTFFNVISFLKELNSLSNFDYIGKFNKQTSASSKIHYFKCNDSFKIPKRISKFSYAEGGFYILSKKALNYICAQKESTFVNKPTSYKGEDVLVGSILKNKVKSLDIKNNNSEKFNMDLTLFSLHPVDTSIFKQLYKKTFNSQLKILQQNQLLNEYNIRDKFLANLKP